MKKYQECLAQQGSYLGSVQIGAVADERGRLTEQVATAADHYFATGDASLFEPLQQLNKSLSFCLDHVRNLIQAERGEARRLVALLDGSPVILLALTGSRDYQFTLEFVTLPGEAGLVGQVVNYAGQEDYNQMYPGWYRLGTGEWRQPEAWETRSVFAVNTKQAGRLLGLQDIFSGTSQPPYPIGL